MILNISINTEDFSEVGQVQMPPTETADSLVDNWDVCVTQAKRISDEWTVNDVIELMAAISTTVDSRQLRSRQSSKGCTRDTIQYLVALFG